MIVLLIITQSETLFINNLNLLKMRNNIYKLLVFLLLVGGTLSCEDGLMEVPQSMLSPENFYKTGVEGIASVNGCYQTNKDNFISNGYGVNVYLDCLTDYQDLAANQFGAFFSNSLSSSYSHIVTLWQRFYTTIGACNVTIGRMENSNIDEEIKNRIIGEARFLRALNYFYLVQLWGPLPLKTTIPQASDNMNLPRASLVEIYEAIIMDLKFAEENCWGVCETRTVGTETYKNDKGRATKGAAKALLAAVYLKVASTASAANRRTDGSLANINTGQVDGLEAYKVFDANTYYELCIQKCNEIEPLGYTLNADYMTNFNTKTKNGIESLFEIQSFGELGYGSRLAPFYCPGYSGLYGGTWGGTIGVLRTFHLNKGPFKIYKNADYDYRPAIDGDVASKVTKFQFDITDYRYKNGFVQSFNQTNQSNRLYKWDAGTARYIGATGGQNTKFFTSKYIDTEGTITDDNSNDFIILRFADILLMKAECLFETGNWNDAWELIRRVHTRGGNQNMESGNIFPQSYASWISNFSGTTDEEKYREAILYERFIELSMEGHRFFDLSRMGKLEEKCAVVGRTKDRKSYYLPISQSEINANEAISELDNNPGYETQAQ